MSLITNLVKKRCFRFGNFDSWITDPGIDPLDVNPRMTSEAACSR